MFGSVGGGEIREKTRLSEGKGLRRVSGVTRVTEERGEINRNNLYILHILSTTRHMYAAII